MNKIEQIIINYQDLSNGTLSLSDDRYGIAAYVLTPSRRKSLLECPFIEDPQNTCAIYFVDVDGVIAGREAYYHTRLKVGNEIFTAETGTAFEVEESYRKYAIGVDITMAAFTRSKLFIGAGVSPMALPLDRKLKFHVLEFPRIMSLRNSRCILESKHISFLTGLVNIPLRLFNKYIIYKANKLAGNYNIKKEIDVPVWVDDIVNNDNHKYAEYHDRKWLQWNLNNNFRGLTQDIQSFYSIYENGIPVGYYMIKERFRDKIGGILNNVLIGSVVEWGVTKETCLKESDIILLSLRNFSKNIDIIETASSDSETIKTCKKYGFIPHGNANIVFKDRTKQFKDASDISLWRVRYGYGDVILT